MRWIEPTGAKLLLSGVVASAWHGLIYNMGNVLVHRMRATIIFKAQNPKNTFTSSSGDMQRGCDGL